MSGSLLYFQPQNSFSAAMVHVKCCGCKWDVALIPLTLAGAKRKDLMGLGLSAMRPKCEQV
jgi:hypothetical protein